MIFRVEALQSGITAHLSADLARRLPAAIKAASVRRDGGKPKDVVEVHHAVLGDALAVILFPADVPDIGELQLVLVQLHGPTCGVNLSPEDAADHAALPGRLPETLGAALVAPMVDGATIADMAPNARRWGGIELLERGDLQPRAAAQWFVTVDGGEGRVVAFYGAYDEDPAIRCKREIDARALALAGWAAATSGSSAAATVGLCERDLGPAVPADAVRH